MNKYIFYLNRVFKMGFKNSILKISFIVKRKIIFIYFKFKDCYFSTFSRNKNDDYEIRYLSKMLLFHFENISLGLYQILDHRFNLLGFISNLESYNVEVKNIELINEINNSNRDHCSELLSLITPCYKYINWHTDPKTKYTWKVDSWYIDILTKGLSGADVKMPWELGRLQHLPRLALGVIAVGHEGICHSQDVLIDEFKNQIIDFIARNPPRFGVNWKCTMDVAIRACNLVVSYGLFEGYTGTTKTDFSKVIFCSFDDHYNHILNNLEWAPEYRGNHYLANLAGLVFLSASRRWRSNRVLKVMKFCMDQVRNEISFQFSEDGSNFECSTTYHTLSTEIIFWTMLWAVTHFPNILDEKSRKIIFTGLWKALEFIQATTLLSGEQIQIGDNDSGQLFKFYVGYQFCYLSNFLVNKFCDFEEVIDFYVKEDGIDLGLLIECSRKRVGSNFYGIKHYHDFGLSIFRNKNYSVFVKCGNHPPKSNGGHAHSDQLSFILSVGEQLVFVDTGSFLYGSDEIARNRMRSSLSHNTVNIEGIEFCEYIKGEIFFNNEKFISSHTVLDDTVECTVILDEENCQLTRSFVFKENSILLKDYITAEYNSVLNFVLHPDLIGKMCLDLNKLTITTSEFVLTVILIDGCGHFEAVEALFSPNYGTAIQTTKCVFFRDSSKTIFDISMEIL